MSESHLAGFNALAPAEAERELLACCAAPAWAAAVAGGRPYPDRLALKAAGDAAAKALTWADVVLALSAHPRIGERPAGQGREAAWSRREQAGADDPSVAAALVRANREYEERFGHVFLIFASGRSAAEMLAAARARLAHDEETERAVVREELRKIALLRLERLVP
ncbi:2-oxo-4-hydroxy-4-carboxy-5-ureidoimidazoline decarboxylase [Phytohabitans suffuscus]|uniref:2-oxo-4-hydroxy-4-carboxy-5-ureidoimidazoline decarboxylase n=1 Tax=Phytohabitans suffuscus TaxID=624315 RepID=A0A6F8YBQ8_9ACTN|nr:2-oxo-4-hydroxy-4-carboxy-5-ureidoimidazoline decarboxylase [Phytohabitans suffuscus]BCB83564.1 OHCU decarboxylase [Phytohabitans suffuscus]